MQLSLFPETRRERLDVPEVIDRALGAGAVVAAHFIRLEEVGGATFKNGRSLAEIVEGVL